MRRWLLASIAAASVLLPSLLRWLQGMPLFPGTQPYVLLTLMESLFSRPVAIGVLLFLLVAIVSLMAITAAAVFRMVPFAAPAADAASLLLVASPVVVGVLQQPLVALQLFLLFAGFALLNGTILSRAFGVALLSVLVALVVSASTPPAFHLAFVEFGASQGYGLFLLLAAIVGASVLWKNKKEYYFTAVGLVLLVGASFFVASLLTLGSVVVAAVAGRGVVQLQRRKWDIPMLRPLSIFLFLCGILFSTVAAMSLVVRDAPSGELAQGFQALHGQSGLVLTEPENAAWLAYWSALPTAAISDDVRTQVWHSRDFIKVRDTIRSEGITTIVITPAMRERLWTDNEEGLLFLLSASTIFKRLPSGSIVEAWAVVPN